MGSTLCEGFFHRTAKSSPRRTNKRATLPSRKCLLACLILIKSAKWIQFWKEKSKLFSSDHLWSDVILQFCHWSLLAVWDGLWCILIHTTEAMMCLWPPLTVVWVIGSQCIFQMHLTPFTLVINTDLLLSDRTGWIGPVGLTINKTLIDPGFTRCCLTGLIYNFLQWRSCQKGKIIMELVIKVMTKKLVFSFAPTVSFKVCLGFMSIAPQYYSTEFVLVTIRINALTLAYNVVEKTTTIKSVTGQILHSISSAYNSLRKDWKCN